MFIISQDYRWKDCRAGSYTCPLYAFFFHFLVLPMYPATVMTTQAPGIFFLPSHLERNQSNHLQAKGNPMISLAHPGLTVLPTPPPCPQAGRASPLPNHKTAGYLNKTGLRGKEKQVAASC